MKKLVVVFLALSIGLSSCKKTEEEEKNPYAIEGSWQVAGGVFIFKNPFTGQDEFQPLFEGTCSFDDIIRFNPNHTLDAFVGTIRCDSTEVDELNDGTWLLDEDKKKLTLSPKGEAAEVYDVWILNETDLQISLKRNSQGMEYEAVLRFKRK